MISRGRELSLVSFFVIIITGTPLVSTPFFWGWKQQNHDDDPIIGFTAISFPTSSSLS